MNREHYLQVIERVAAFASTILVANMLPLASGVELGLELPHLVAISSLSLLLPGLGPAAITTLCSLTLALEGGLSLVESLLLLLVAALSFRYWYASILWIASLSFLHSTLVNAAMLGAMIGLLQLVNPVSAAALMLSYSLAVSLKACFTLPEGDPAILGMVVVAGSPVQPTGHPVLDAARVLGEWFSTNLLGSPNFLFQALIFAAAGAAPSKLREATGKGWLASLPSAFLLLASTYALSRKLGIPVAHSLLVVPLSSFIASLLVGLTHSLNLRPPRRGLSLEAPPQTLHHLREAWKALYAALKRGEHVIVVFGSPGCGKTWLVGSVCGALGFRVARQPEAATGKVGLVDLDACTVELKSLVSEFLHRGARAVVVETRQPSRLLAVAKNIEVNTAIYVPLPDARSRLEVLKSELGNIVPISLISELADKTSSYSLRALSRLSRLVRELVEEEGLEPRRAVVEAIERVPPDVTPLDLLEIERFISGFEGVIVGFMKPLTQTE